MRTRYPSVRLHLARQFDGNGDRTIMLGTNRPIGWVEVMNNGRSMDYDLTVIQLTLDADNTGNGMFIFGAEIEFDKDTHKITLEKFQNSQTRLTNTGRRIRCFEQVRVDTVLGSQTITATVKACWLSASRSAMAPTRSGWRPRTG